MNGLDTAAVPYFAVRHFRPKGIQTEFWRHIPCKWTIMRLVNMFAESGSTARGPHHRDPHVPVQEAIAVVAIQANLRISTRNLSA